MKQRTPEPPEQRRSAYLDNGLAPPKLYRREQQQAASRQQRQAPPMTRQERRKKQNKTPPVKAQCAPGFGRDRFGAAGGSDCGGAVSDRVL